MCPRVVVAILLALAPGAFASTACVIPPPRVFVGGTRTVMRVHAVSESELEVVSVVYGHDRRGLLTLAGHDLRNTCGNAEKGVDYLATEMCGEDWRCTLSFRRLDQAAADLAFLNDRHFVRRSDVLRSLRLWRDGALATRRFQRWLAAADTDEVERNDSLTLHLIDNLETFTADIADLEDIDPGLAGAIRAGAVRRLIDDLTCLPVEETKCEYQGSEQRWPSWQELYDSLNVALTAMYESPDCVRASEVLFQARP